MALPVHSEPAEAHSTGRGFGLIDHPKLQSNLSDAGEDRYEAAVAEMAEACRQRHDFDAWLGRFNEFLARIHAWCHDHRDVILAAYVVSADEGLKVFMTTAGEDYCFDVDDVLTDFELDLARQFPMCPTQLLQMPAASPDALRSFFSPERALQVYGQPAAA